MAYRKRIKDSELQGARAPQPTAAAQFGDIRATAAIQRQQQALMGESPLVQRQLFLQQTMAASSVQQQKSKPNNTGLPDNLKSGIESLSGVSMDNVKVHYNSDKPAQLNAHAYAQGTDIHVAPGQEKHLPHEAWHVVQQAQGRVKPTTQMKGTSVNNDVGLEREADVMGAKALDGNHHTVSESQLNSTQRKASNPTAQLFYCKNSDGDGWEWVSPFKWDSNKYEKANPIPPEWASTIFTLYQEKAVFGDQKNIKGFMGGGLTAIGGEAVNIASLISSLEPLMEYLKQFSELIVKYWMPGFDFAVSIALLALGIKQFYDATEEENKDTQREQYKSAAFNIAAAFFSLAAAVFTLTGASTFGAVASILSAGCWAIGEAIQAQVAEEGGIWFGGSVKASSASLLVLFKLFDLFNKNIKYAITIAASGAGIGAGISASRHITGRDNSNAADGSNEEERIEIDPVSPYRTFPSTGLPDSEVV